MNTNELENRSQELQGVQNLAEERRAGGTSSEGIVSVNTSGTEEQSADQKQVAVQQKAEVSRLMPEYAGLPEQSPNRYIQQLLSILERNPSIFSKHVLTYAVYLEKAMAKI